MCIQSEPGKVKGTPVTLRAWGLEVYKNDYFSQGHSYFRLSSYT